MNVAARRWLSALTLVCSTPAVWAETPSAPERPAALVAARRGAPHGPAVAPVGAIPWQAFAQGEYVGPPRAPHLPEYRLRVDDTIECVYRLTREESSSAYRLNVGDVVMIESLTDADMRRGDMQTGQGLVVQPDGTITVRLLGQVRAARLTVDELRSQLVERYRKYYKDPDITVTPLKVNTRLEDLRSAIDNRYGAGGQTRRATVTPEGTIQLPAIGSVPTIGLSLIELKHELDERYAQIVEGIEVTPVLATRAPRFVFVLGEVARPGRYTLDGPTTVMQSIALAGGWNPGGALQQIVVFRRDDHWRLIGTRLELRSALWGQSMCNPNDVWIRDADIVLVPKSALQITDDFINLIFTRGIYGIVPVTGNVSLTSGSTL